MPDPGDKKIPARTIPVDSGRCQAEIREGSFMTLGPRKFSRCTGKPVWVAVEFKDGKLIGAMSLCASCKKVCEESVPEAQFWEMCSG
jgi:hypothetical protein